MKHMGSRFDDFLAEEGILEEVESNAIERVLAIQLVRESTQTSIIDSGSLKVGKDIKTGSSK